jgi:hypothetical protein
MTRTASDRPDLSNLSLNEPPALERRQSAPDAREVERNRDAQPDRPSDLCLVHAHEVHGHGGSRTPYAKLFLRSITQVQARDLFNAGSPMGTTAEEPMQGQTRLANMDGMPVIVKKFGAGGFKVSEIEAKQWAEREVRAHIQLWRNIAPEARRFFAAPACMDFDPPVFEFVDKRRTYAFPYTVQAMVQCWGTHQRLESAWNFFKPRIDQRMHSPFHSMSIAAVRTLCEQYGEMIAVMHRAGIIHDDLHQDNVLVCHNGNDPHTKWSEPAGAPNGLYIQFKVIDFGKAEQHPHGNPPNLPIFPCLYRENDEQRGRYREETPPELRAVGRGVTETTPSGESVVVCAGETENVLALIRNAFYRGPPPTPPTQHELVAWVRDGYMEQLQKPWYEWKGADDEVLERFGTRR